MDGDAAGLAAWLQSLGLGQYEQAFRDNDIDASLLPMLTDSDLRELGILSLGHRKRLLAAISELTKPTEGSPMSLPASPPQPFVRLQAERRQLTVMFVDLVGSTALSSRLDPEEMREVLHAYQNAVTGEIARVGGQLAKLMGDGVLAYFGWPRADEDDPERAVLAGLSIVQAVKRLSTPFGDQLAARVGIATGLVVVGDLIGEGAAREEAVIGETPNLAARLQEIAPSGTVVIAAGTRRLLGDIFDLRDLGPVHLKGFDRPIDSFEVLRPHPAESRFAARQPDRASPMVGRDQELALVLERWRQSVAGDGQAMLMVGEAGIGKSRLVQALLDETATEPHIALRYQCSPLYMGTPLWPVVQQLGFAAGFAPDDDDEQKRQKLERLLRRGQRILRRPSR
ncbi:adenylate/guanylate cyclase domain-containing protein [Microvirga sp. 0TCS3.31]